MEEALGGAPAPLKLASPPQTTVWLEGKRALELISKLAAEAGGKPVSIELFERQEPEVGRPNDVRLKPVPNPVTADGSAIKVGPNIILTEQSRFLVVVDKETGNLQLFHLPDQAPEQWQVEHLAQLRRVFDPMPVTVQKISTLRKTVRVFGALLLIGLSATYYYTVIRPGNEPIPGQKAPGKVDVKPEPFNPKADKVQFNLKLAEGGLPEKMRLDWGFQVALEADNKTGPQRLELALVFHKQGGLAGRRPLEKGAKLEPVRKFYQEVTVPFGKNMLPITIRPDEIMDIGVPPGEWDVSVLAYDQVDRAHGEIYLGRTQIIARPEKAGAEETDQEGAYTRAYRQAVERIKAVMTQLNVRTSLTPGEIWTLAHLAAPDGSIVVIPRDQRIEGMIPPAETGLDLSRAANRYQVATSVPLIRAARQKDRPVALLVEPSLLDGHMFRKLRKGEVPFGLELMGMTAEEAVLFGSTPVLAQGEDAEAPRWKPAQNKISPAFAVRSGAVGFKAGVLLGVQLPGYAYHSRWSALAGQNLDWVKKQAAQALSDTGGEGLGLLATALIYAAPYKDYVPNQDDMVRKEDWMQLNMQLERDGYNLDRLRSELAGSDPADWAVGAQLEFWLKSRTKRELEATREFARAHEDMTYRLAREWNDTPGITMIMASSPTFASSAEQWETREEQALEAIGRLSSIPGISGKWVLPSRDKAPSVYKAEVEAMEKQNLLVGIAAGRTLTQALLQPTAEGKEFYPTKHPYYQAGLRSSVRNLNQLLNRFGRNPASIWTTHGITPEQAEALVAATTAGTNAAGAEEAQKRRFARGLAGRLGLAGVTYADLTAALQQTGPVAGGKDRVIFAALADVSARYAGREEAAEVVRLIGEQLQWKEEAERRLLALESGRAVKLRFVDAMLTLSAMIRSGQITGVMFDWTGYQEPVDPNDFEAYVRRSKWDFREALFEIDAATLRIKVDPAGAEESAVISNAVKYFGRPLITAVMGYMLERNEVKPVEPYFENAPEVVGLRKAGLAPYLVPSRLNVPSAAPAPAAIRVLAQPEYRDAVRQQMAGAPVEVVDDPALAQFVVGDPEFVQAMRTGSAALRARFLQLNDTSLLERITPQFLAQLLDRPDLFPAGSVLQINLLVKGDLGEGLLLFA